MVLARIEKKIKFSEKEAHHILRADKMGSVMQRWRQASPAAGNGLGQVEERMKGEKQQGLPSGTEQQPGERMCGCRTRLQCSLLDA